MNLSALPLILGGSGLVRMCFGFRSLQAAAKLSGLMARAIIGHHAGHGDTKILIGGNRCPQRCDGADDLFTPLENCSTRLI